MAAPPHLLDDRQPRLVGQIVVQEHQVQPGQRLQLEQRLGSAVGLAGDMEARHLLDVGGIDPRDSGVVVHDQDLDHHDSFLAVCGADGTVRAGSGPGSASASGRTTVNSAPPP